MASLAVVVPGLVAATGWLVLVMAAVATAYMIACTIVFRRFFRHRMIPVPATDAVTLLKPLSGHEPDLLANLRTFLAQDHRGPIQMICGVAASDDAALDAVRSLKSERPDDDIATVISAVRHGTSAKVSNLVNMFGHASHPVIVVSDSDMVTEPGYLARVLSSLDEPGVGAVTALYRGRGDAGFWSRLGAAGLSYQFLPGAVFGVALGIARPCMGSTIALKQATVHRIGGFGRFADELADDYAIGAAIRSLGLKVAVPRFLMTHASTETSLAQWWRHELRWGATIRSVVPAAYLGSILAMPVPLAIAGIAFVPGHWIGFAVLASALLSRLLLMAVVDAEVGEATASRWLLPIRDCLTMVVFISSLFIRTVDWRGQRHEVLAGGRLGPDTELVA